MTELTINLTERGRNGGKARAKNMTPAQRKASATKAIKARWAKYRRDNPGKRRKARRKK